jgi:hypothetical protein
MTRAKLLVPLGVLLGAVGAWIWWQQGGLGGPVSDAAARHYFSRIVAAAQAKDLEALCRLNSSVGTCQAELRVYCPESFPVGPGGGPEFPAGEDLEEECGESIPTEPPQIVASRHRPAMEGRVGGRLLVVKGIDGRGKAYETEVLIFRDKRSFKATHAVFWSGSKFPSTDTARPEPAGE